MKPPRSDTLYAAAIFLAAAAYFAAFAPWGRPVQLDAATWDYMAVEMARGLVPYRDVFLHKTPGAAFLGGCAAWVGQALGIAPVVAARTLFLALGALAPALLFAICRASRMPLGAATAAAFALLAFDQWPIAALEGCRPKVPTVAFGLAAMLAAERGRAVSASFLGGISVLCWQPGLAFLLGAWATTLRQGERRFSRWATLAAYSLIPAAVMLAWLAGHGAFADFFDQAVFFNLHYIEDKARPLLGTLRALRRTLADWNDVEVLLAPAAAAGLWAGVRLRAAADPVATQLARLPLSVIASGAVYGAMTFVSYQSWPDAILLTPLLATLLGVGLYNLLATRLDPRTAGAIAVLVITLAAVPDDRPKFQPAISFDVQRERFLSLAQGLADTDRVVGVSVPEFFLHTGRRNGWKWPYLWFGVDEFAADHTAGGFEGVLADLEHDPPALILVTRLWGGPNRLRFEEWASTRYDLSVVRAYPHLRTPLRVYRKKP